MFDEVVLGIEFFEGLTRIDAAIAGAVAAGGCLRCGCGRLHRSDYDRKPCGGTIGAAVETCRRRFSLCCDRRGCRRRATLGCRGSRQRLAHLRLALQQGAEGLC